jgi:hypothetical protein
MNVPTPVVVADAHRRIEGMNLTAILGHGFVEGPLIVDSK